MANKVDRPSVGGDYPSEGEKNVQLSVKSKPSASIQATTNPSFSSLDKILQKIKALFAKMRPVSPSFKASTTPTKESKDVEIAVKTSLNFNTMDITEENVKAHIQYLKNEIAQRKDAVKELKADLKKYRQQFDTNPSYKNAEIGIRRIESELEDLLSKIKRDKGYLEVAEKHTLPQAIELDKSRKEHEEFQKRLPSKYPPADLDSKR